MGIGEWLFPATHRCLDEEASETGRGCAGMVRNRMNSGEEARWVLYRLWVGREEMADEFGGERCGVVGVGRVCRGARTADSQRE